MAGDSPPAWTQDVYKRQIYNRLADTGSHGTYGMLQVDASLLYALPGHEGAITNDDKKVDSKYNLYKLSLIHI